MTVIVLERVPIAVRGELTRWMLELRAGVFIGSLTAMVREKLWAHICQRMKTGAGLLIYNSDNEQGFAMQYWGNTDRQVVDYDGLALVRVPPHQSAAQAEPEPIET